MGREQVASRLANYLDEKTVMRCLDDLYSKRLIYREANRFVSLALPEAWYANRKSMMPEKIIEEPIATSMS
jgi:hypothetical protein